MQTIPNSELYLIANVPLTPNYEYTLDFDSLSQQTAYFNGKISSILTINEDYSYIRQSQKINICVNIEELHNINYLKFKNADKWVYAFILNKEYIHDKCTAITFKVDVLQTFMFDYEIDESFVEREHQDRYVSSANVLTPIFNRETENIEKGEDYILKDDSIVKDNIPTNFDAFDNENFRLYWLTVVTREKLGTNTKITTNNGVSTNVYTYIMPYAERIGLNAGIFNYVCGSVQSDTANLMPNALNENSIGSISENPNIISISISKYAPFNYGVKKLISSPVTYYMMYPLDNTVFDTPLKLDELTIDNVRYGGWLVGEANFVTKPIYNLNRQLTKPNDLNIEDLKDIDNEPKLLTRPYQYLSLEFSELKQELDLTDFGVNEAKLKMLPTFSVRNTNVLAPINYKNEEINKNYSIKLDGANQELPLRTDAWLQYLSQNKNSLISGMVTSAVGGVASTIGGFLTGGLGNLFGLTGAISTVNNIANKVAQINDLKQTPDQVNKPSLDIVQDLVLNNLDIHIKNYSIRDSFKNRCFNYFYRFGYQCNDFKKPNVRSRYYFNYIKTIGANIKTNIDADYRTEIEDIFNKGVTIWHYRTNDTFKGVNNYDYENVEINLMQEDIVNE